jgi:Phosphopantetheine attachment site
VCPGSTGVAGGWFAVVLAAPGWPVRHRGSRSCGLLRRSGPGRTPQPEDTFTALGLDSLDRLTLAVSVEQSVGLTVSDQILSAAVSPADLTSRLLAVPIGAFP